jgi:predicted nucleotidyltransferase
MAIARLYNVESADVMPEVMRFVECVKNIAGVESVILFGSLARNEMTAVSDIDLAIIVDQPSRVKALKETVRQCKRSSLTWPADIFICDRDWYEKRKKFGGICVLIAAQGKILFERPKGGLTSGT